MGMFFHREKGLFFIAFVEDKKMAGTKKIWKSMWKKLRKNVDFEEPTPVVDQVGILGTYTTRTQN